MTDFKKSIIIVTMMAILFVTLMVSGCGSQYAIGDGDGPVTKEIIRLQTIYKTNWLASVLIVAIVLGAIATLNGFKAGITIVIASIGGLYCLAAYQTFASHPYWPLIMAISGLLIAGGAVVYSLFIKDKGFAILKGK